MTADSVSLGFGVAVLSANLILGYYVYRLRRGSPTSADGVSDAHDGAHVDLEAGVVECPDCGTANDVGSRYCRHCVNELPAGVSFADEADGPLGRAMR